MFSLKTVATKIWNGRKHVGPNPLPTNTEPKSTVEISCDFKSTRSPASKEQKKKNPIWPFILASFQQQNETILRLFKNEKHISLINTHSRCEFEFSWETRNNVVDDAESSFVVYFLDGVVFGESETTSIVGVVVVVGEGEGGFYSELGCEESASRQPH